MTGTPTATASAINHRLPLNEETEPSMRPHTKKNRIVALANKAQVSATRNTHTASVEPRAGGVSDIYRLAAHLGLHRVRDEALLVSLVMHLVQLLPAWHAVA